MNEEIRNENLKENDTQQQDVENSCGTEQKKQGKVHLIFKIIIGVLYALTTGYLIAVLAQTLTLMGFAILGYLAVLCYLAPVYVVNIILSIVGLVLTNKDVKAGKCEKSAGRIYTISIIVNILTYAAFWLVIVFMSIFS